jgi:hypothetical protein
VIEDVFVVDALAHSYNLAEDNYAAGRGSKPSRFGRIDVVHCVSPCWMLPVAIATGNTFVLKPSSVILRLPFDGRAVETGGPS